MAWLAQAVVDQKSREPLSLVAPATFSSLVAQVNSGYGESSQSDPICWVGSAATLDRAICGQFWRIVPVSLTRTGAPFFLPPAPGSEL